MKVGEVRLRGLITPLVILYLISLFFQAEVENSPTDRLGPLVVEVVVARGTSGNGIGNVPVLIQLDNRGQTSESTAQTNQNGKVVWTFIIQDEARIRISIDRENSSLRDLRDPDFDVFRDGTRFEGGRNIRSRTISTEVPIREGSVVKVVILFEPQATPALTVTASPTPTTTETPSPTKTPVPAATTIPRPEPSYAIPAISGDWLRWLLWGLVILAVILLTLILIGLLSPAYYATHWPAANAFMVAHPVLTRWVALLVLALLVIFVLLALGYR